MVLRPRPLQAAPVERRLKLRLDALDVATASRLALLQLLCVARPNRRSRDAQVVREEGEQRLAHETAACVRYQCILQCLLER